MHFTELVRVQVIPSQKSPDCHPEHPFPAPARVAIRMEECHVGSILLPSLKLPFLDLHVPGGKYQCRWDSHAGKQYKHPYEYCWDDYKDSETVILISITSSNGQ